jgi:CAAX prenyl protease-like protein
MRNSLSRTAVPPWLPYVGPMGVYLELTAVEGALPDYYPLVYSIKVAAVGAALIAAWPFVVRSRPAVGGARARGAAGYVALALAAGVALAAAWVLVDQITPHFDALGTRAGFNPFERIAAPGPRLAFLVVRLAGLVLVAPLVEEWFYRDFLLRIFTDVDDFRRTAIGRFGLVACGANVVLFSLSHPEWLAAAVFAAAMCLLLWHTRSVAACVIAHAATNGALGIYVLATGAWQYW